MVNGERRQGSSDEDESMMDSADVAALEAAESSFNARTSTGANGTDGPNGVAGPSSGPGQPEKKKMKISCKYDIPSDDGS